MAHASPLNFGMLHASLLNLAWLACFACSHARLACSLHASCMLHASLHGPCSQPCRTRLQRACKSRMQFHAAMRDLTTSHASCLCMPRRMQTHATRMQSSHAITCEFMQESSQKVAGKSPQKVIRCSSHAACQIERACMIHASCTFACEVVKSRMHPCTLHASPLNLAWLMRSSQILHEPRQTSQILHGCMRVACNSRMQAMRACMSHATGMAACKEKCACGLSGPDAIAISIWQCCQCYL
jgi:hypothetical protein